MLRALMVAAIMLILTVQAQAQQSKNAQGRGIFTHDLAQRTQHTGVKPQAEGDLYLEPTDSFLKLQRQIDFQFLPAGFFPANETETDSFKLKALRYAVGYYRDCEVPGLEGFFDVMLGMRFDTRNGALDVRYFHVALVINPNKVQFPEDRSAMALMQASEGSALLFLFEGSNQELVSFEGLFTENPHAVNFFTADDVDGVKTDESVQKFAVFVRGGADRASLFVLNTDSTLNELKTYEVIQDLSSTDRAYIFSIQSPLIPYRGVVVK